MIELILDFSDEQEQPNVAGDLLEVMRRAIISVLENEGMDGCFEVSLSIVDKPDIRALNAAYRGIDRVTDVLSFPLGENGEYPKNLDNGAFMLGDIVICAQIAREQAAEYGHGEEREFGFLCAHSSLHLLGYDHVDSEEQAREMEQKQEDALEKIDLRR